MDTLTIPRGDKGYNINFIVTDDLGVVKNITAYTITFKMWNPNSPGTIVTSGSCVIDSGASGTCHYVLTASDMLLVGQYQAELELTASGIIESTKSFIVDVKESA